MRPHAPHGPPRPLLVFSLLALGAALAALGALTLLVAASPTPDIASFATRTVPQSTKIYDRTGQVLLYDYNRDARREIVALANISENMVKATLATEDASFYSHGGIRLTSIARAMLADLFGASLSQGGSTITQQVVKNALLTNEKSLLRKIHEWVLAVKMEQVYSKDQILAAYLNDIPFGSTLYGVEAASEAYFGTPAKALTLPEAAYLAAMIQAPSYYSPYGTHRALLNARKNFVLMRMRDLGTITAAEYDDAARASVVFAPQAQNTIIAPHFVFYVLDYLEKKYGSAALVTGLKVTTTLDADLERVAEGTVNQYALDNEKKFKASNAALVALDPSTGQILAMVGSRDFFDPTIDGQYNATLALRQPGSAMKPFIYSLALEKGFTRDTVIYDVPTQFSTSCRPDEVTNDVPPCYAPQDYDRTFRGPMTFESALAQSINIPAVKVLYLVGVGNAVALAENFGLSTLGDPDRYGLTLVLGGGEVRLLDLVDAYSTFGNDGIRNPAGGVLEVDGPDGSALERYASAPVPVVPENIARDMSAMLSDNPARFPEYPPNSPLAFPDYDVAVKTGTTNDTRDAWVVGYTPSIALGVWTGNNDNTPMVKSIAGFIAAPMWHAVMQYALSKYPRAYFGEPDPISASSSPVLRGVARAPDRTGALVPHDVLYWADKNDPAAEPTNPASDPQYRYWEYGVSAWYAAHPDFFVNPPTFVPIAPAEAATSSAPY